MENHVGQGTRFVRKEGHVKSEVVLLRAAERSRSGDAERPHHLPQRVMQRWGLPTTSTVQLRRLSLPVLHEPM